MRSTTIVSLATAIALAQAARPCPNPLAPLPWTISEWTYDAPDPTGRGRAAIDSTVGLYLVTGGTDFSCYGSWPEAWDGWADEGRSLVWFSCIVNRGRMVDETVSFAMDWKNATTARTLQVAHSYVCEGGGAQHILARASVPLNLDCQSPTPGGKPSRCITRERQLSVGTRPEVVATGSTSASCGAPNTSGWEVRGYSSLTSATSGTEGTASSPLVIRSLGDGTAFNCAKTPTTILEGSKTVQGSCTPVSSSSGGNTSLTFSFDPEVRLLSLLETRVCAGSGNSVITRGAGHVPFSCLPTSSASCEAEAAFWIGGQAATS